MRWSVRIILKYNWQVERLQAGNASLNYFQNYKVFKRLIYRRIMLLYCSGHGWWESNRLIKIRHHLDTTIMTNEIEDPRNLIRQAYQALKGNDKQTAESLARRAAELAPDLETPWLILATLAEPAQAVDYAQHALQINPESRPAQEAFKWALARRAKEAPAPPAAEPSPQPVTQTAPDLESLTLPGSQTVTAQESSPEVDRKVRLVREPSPQPSGSVAEEVAAVETLRELQKQAEVKPARQKGKISTGLIVFFIVIDLILIAVLVSIIIFQPI